MRTSGPIRRQEPASGQAGDAGRDDDGGDEAVAGLPDQDAIARYIADLTQELAGMARGSRLDLVAYLLDIAHLEANATAARLSGSDRTI